MQQVKLPLRPANNQELAFCESLTRSNISADLATRKIPWDTARFVASWAEFENLLIMANSQVVGLLRLLPEQDAIGTSRHTVSSRTTGLCCWLLGDTTSTGHRGQPWLPDAAASRLRRESGKSALCSLGLQNPVVRRRHDPDGV